MGSPLPRAAGLPRRTIWSPGPAARALPVVQPRSVGCRLDAHLQAWLGAWPPKHPLELIVWPGRDEPGWDGGVWPGLGIESPVGTVLSLSPAIVADAVALDPERVRAALHSPEAGTAVPVALGQPDLCLTRAAFRWSASPTALPRRGEWVDRHDPRLPPWLRPFNGGILVAWGEADRVAAGVGIKRHNPHGHELAVGTDPAHRGQGLARALIAQAARRVLAEGAVPLYLHDQDNATSARVATSAGFPDQGWRVIGLLPEVYPTRTHPRPADRGTVSGCPGHPTNEAPIRVAAGFPERG